MKRLIVHIVLFLLPILIGLIFIPVSKRSMFLGLKDDCFNHGIWIHDRIFNNPEPVDILFLGSSHTINGINDKLISEKLSSRQAINFGYCRLGRNLEYSLLKTILSEKKIKKLVIEVREGENWFSHPVFPFIADDKDVYLANPLFNSNLIKDMWKHTAYKLELFQERIYLQSDSVPYNMNNFGFASHADTISSEYLKKIKLKNTGPKKEMSRLEQDYRYTYSRIYIKKIVQICREESIKIYFVYLPSYGTNRSEPREMKIYEKFGPVLIPPKEIYENVYFWFDENHLNLAGAEELSEWITANLEF